MKRRWREPARGVAIGSSSRRIAATFDDETFADVRQLAKAAGVSFAEQTRQLVEWGLAAVKDGERNAAGAARRGLR